MILTSTSSCPSEICWILLRCSLRNPLRPNSRSSESSLENPFRLDLGLIDWIEQAGDETVLLGGGFVRVLGGERRTSGGGIGRREGGRSVWNRDLRVVGGGSEIGGLEGLRTLDIHFWTAEEGFIGSSTAAEETEKDSDLLRLWRTTLERISPLKLSTALCLSSPLTTGIDSVSD